MAKLNLKQILSLAFFLSLTSFCVAADRQEFEWPDGAIAAVSLAYDDAVASHLDHAIPDLDRHRLKGTFYLTLASETLELRQQEWRAAAARGHELGNHSLFHPCAKSGDGREWVKPWNDLDQIPAEAMAERIRLANLMLMSLDGRTERTFTPPCGDLEAGGMDYVELVKPMFVAIKATGDSAIPDMLTLDPYAVPVEGPVGVDGAHLVALVEEAGRRGTMVNFTFHGIGGDYLSVSREAHAELLQFLADNRDRYWTDTFLNIMHYVKANQPFTASGRIAKPPPHGR